MNTKKILNKTFAVAALAVSALGMSSCSDFLEITPMNEVVLEKFWVKKADANKALMGCYESLYSDDNISRMGMWGEIRSDNIKRGNGASYEIEQILQEKILPTFSICNWGSFYQTINRCNTFCYYAPSVCKKDPNYTESDMKANVAEAVAIRSLCYFYLIRTFKEVPFTRRPSLDDTQNYVYPAEKFENVLDSLIDDLKAVENDAVLRYYNYETSDYMQGNCARVTRNFIYSLLAELYLWKGNYDECIAYGQKVVDFKKKQYNSLVSLYAENTEKHIALYGEYPLIRDVVVGDAGKTIGNAYKEIFGTGSGFEFWGDTRGFSFESIFELSFQGKDNKYIFENYNLKDADDYSVGPLATPIEFCTGLPDRSTEYFDSTDVRAYEYIDATKNNQHGIRKYVVSSVSGLSAMNPAPVKNLSNARGVVERENNTLKKNRNWIIYRLTDVMLMMAEAYVEKGNFEAAYNIVNAVNTRSNGCYDPYKQKEIKEDLSGGTLAERKDKYMASLESMRMLVLQERHRELMFEGKRWYDLVRYSRRVGDNTYLAKMSSIKQINGGGTVQNILTANPDILYLPYSREELKLNHYLKQNQAYNLGFDDEIQHN